jgi:hypothetical protein
LDQGRVASDSFNKKRTGIEHGAWSEFGFRIAN